MTLPRVFRWHWIAALVWLAMVAIAHSEAGVPLPVFFALAGVMIALGVTWVMCVLLVVIARRPTEPKPSRRSIAAAPAALLAGVLLAAAGSPWLLSARVWLGGDALLRDAPQLASVKPALLFEHPRRVGLFRVREFAQYGPELRFLTTDCGVVDTCGVVFSPEGRPPRRGEDSFSHLYGPWWHWHQSF